MSLLGTFSKSELTRFRKYLASPYFNENEDLICLFAIVEKHLRKLEEGDDLFALKKARVWKQLFRGAPYVDSVIRRLSFELNQHAYQFLLVEKQRVQDGHSQLVLLDYFIEHQLEKHYLSLRRQLAAKFTEQVAPDMLHYFQHFQWQLREHKKIEKSRPKKPFFQHIETADYRLDCFYLLQKLRHYCDALGYQLFLCQEANIRIPPFFLSFIEEHFLAEAPVKAYYLVAQMLMHPEEAHLFKSLKQYLLEQQASIDRHDLQILYIHLQNYCIHIKINAGHTEYFQELFDIQKTLIEQEIVFEDGVLGTQYYKNVITVGLHIKAFDWVEHFIQHYTERLPKAKQENSLNYNLAKVYFHRKEYDRVIELLREVTYKNINYALGGKLMLLKTYYEQQEYLVLDSLADSFRIYLQRNKLISRSLKQQYLNLIRFVKKLSNVAPYDKAAIAKMERDAKQSKSLADKAWVFEKIRELKGVSVETEV